MSKRNRVICLCLALAFVLLLLPFSAFAAEGNAKLDIAVISDPHFFLPEYVADTEEFRAAAADGRPLLAESSVLFDAYLADLCEKKPDVLLIPGDLSGDGAKAAHEAVAKRLLAVKEKLPELKVYVINGNHDINRTDSRNYNAGSVPSVTPAEFESIYGFTYGDESIVSRFVPTAGQAANGLSYAARPCDGVTLLALDSCMYSADITSCGLDRGEADGQFSAALENWICEQTAAAQARGDTVLAMMHHNLVPHFSLEPVIYQKYLLNDYERISAFLADLGISFVFTGHMHANDIAATTTKSGNTLYDIMTSSLVCYPAAVRTVALEKTEDETTLDIKTFALKEINATSPLTGEVIGNLAEYGLARGFSAQAISSKVQGHLRGIVTKYITSNSKTAEWFTDRLNGHIDSIIRQACAIQVDAEHTLLDAVNYVYYMMLAGEEQGNYPAWVQSVLKRTESGELIGTIMDIAKKEAFGDLANLTRYKGLITRSVEKALGKAVVQLADTLGKDSNYAADNNTALCAPTFLPPEATEEAASKQKSGTGLLQSIWNRLTGR